MTPDRTERPYLQAEEYAYPNGGQTRKGRAMYPDGVIRRVWAGIPDTYFSIPAHGRMHGRYVGGFLTLADWRDAERLDIPEGTLTFTPYQRYTTERGNA